MYSEDNSITFYATSVSLLFQSLTCWWGRPESADPALLVKAGQGFSHQRASLTGSRFSDKRAHDSHQLLTRL